MTGAPDRSRGPATPPVQLLAYGFAPGAAFEGQLVGTIERIESGGTLRGPRCAARCRKRAAAEVRPVVMGHRVPQVAAPVHGAPQAPTRISRERRKPRISRAWTIWTHRTIWMLPRMLPRPRHRGTGGGAWLDCLATRNAARVLGLRELDSNLRHADCDFADPWALQRRLRGLGDTKGDTSATGVICPNGLWLDGTVGMCCQRGACRHPTRGTDGTANPSSSSAIASSSHVRK